MVATWTIVVASMVWAALGVIGAWDVALRWTGHQTLSQRAQNEPWIAVVVIGLASILAALLAVHLARGQ